MATPYLFNGDLVINVHSERGHLVQRRRTTPDESFAWLAKQVLGLQAQVGQLLQGYESLEEKLKELEEACFYED